MAWTSIRAVGGEQNRAASAVLTELLSKIDKARRTAYNAGSLERGYRVRPGERCAVHKTAVSHFPAKGGEAYGKQTLGESPSLPGMLHLGLFDLDVHIPRSALAARMAPSG
jgi:hypothetical protein